LQVAGEDFISNSAMILQALRRDKETKARVELGEVRRAFCSFML
jgi:hypothetical protein